MNNIVNNTTTANVINTSDIVTNRNIVLCGVGGQGTVLASKLLAAAAMSKDIPVMSAETIGMAQRGGSVVTFVRYGESVAEPIVEEGQADILIAFERLEALRYAHFLKKGGAIIVNDTRIDPMPVVIGAAEYPEHILEELSKKYNVLAVDATAEALKLGNARVFNTIILGVAAQHMHFSKEEWLQVIADTVPPKTIDINQKAFLTGYAYNGNHTEQGQE